MLAKVFGSDACAVGSLPRHDGGQPAKPAFDEKAVADFYRGKTVRIVVGFSAGGGYDQYSRLIARHLSQVTFPATRACSSTTWPAPAA